MSRHRESARNQFLRPQEVSPRKTISSKERTTAKTRAIALGLSNISLVKEQHRG